MVTQFFDGNKTQTSEIHTSMCQAKGPQTQVGCSVGDAAQTVLDRVDALVDKHLGEVELKTLQQH